MTPQVLLAIVTRLFGVKAGQFAKAVLPATGTVVAVGVQWGVTGKFDKAELATAVTGLGASALSYLVPNLKLNDMLDFIPSEDLQGHVVNPPLSPTDEPADVPDAPDVPESVPPAASAASASAQAPDSALPPGPPPIAPGMDEPPPPPPVVPPPNGQQQ